MLILLMLACKPSKPEVPTTVAPAPAPVPTPAPPATVPPGATDSFGSFYEAFQDKVCDLADTGGCDDAYDDLNCDDPSTVPACTGYDADAALLCLQRESTCDGETLNSSSACALVCEDQDFSEVGAYRSEVCLEMIACDNALAAAVADFNSSWPQGENDPDYGIGGSCFDVDRDACEAACASAIEAFEIAADAYESAGLLNGIPVECGGNGTLPLPPTPPAFTWTVTLADGDNVPDNGFDADTVTVRTTNSVANFPSVIEWEFGYGQTEVPNGWFGEDCDGAITQGSDICHLWAPDSTMVLQRTSTIGGIVPGSTTLMQVDFPVSSTPRITSVIYGYDSNDFIIECFIQGHQVSYYAAGGCDVYTP